MRLGQDGGSSPGARDQRCDVLQLEGELAKLATQKLRYGYRRLHAVLERRGHAVSVKRIYRLYAEQGLVVRRRKRLVREQMIRSEERRVGKECQ